MPAGRFGPFREMRLTLPKVVPIALLGAAGIGLLIASWRPALENRVTYGTFDTGPPPRVDYCGRRYYPGNQTQTLAEVRAFLAENGLTGLTRVATAPSGMPVVANVMPLSVRASYHTKVCTMQVWVQSGPDSYRPYALSGGP